jgi:hypothetical protein
MNSVNKNKQQDALATWLAKTDWQVFGTLKFTDGHSISEHKAEAIVSKFFNSLDRAYLGRNLVDAGHRLERVVFTCCTNTRLHRLQLARRRRSKCYEIYNS